MFGLWMVEVHHRRERFARKSVDLAVTQGKKLSFVVFQLLYCSLVENRIIERGGFQHAVYSIYPSERLLVFEKLVIVQKLIQLPFYQCSCSEGY